MVCIQKGTVMSMDYKRASKSAYMGAGGVSGRGCQVPYAGSLSARTVLGNTFVTSKPEKQLAMMYAPYQKFEDLYPIEKGFLAGTIFVQLDLPCTACTSCCVRR